MTTVDGDRLPGSVPNVPGATLTVLELESVRTGRTRGELVALAVDAMFSTAAAPSPAGAVDGGQGATRPPAPTIYRHPIAHIHHGSGECVFGDRCGR
jgi:hypothetical protein